MPRAPTSRVRRQELPPMPCTTRPPRGCRTCEHRTPEHRARGHRRPQATSTATSRSRSSASRRSSRAPARSPPPPTSRSTRCASVTTRSSLPAIGRLDLASPRARRRRRPREHRLDLLGHARSFLHYAGSYDGRSEDDLASSATSPSSAAPGSCSSPTATSPRRSPGSSWWPPTCSSCTRPPGEQRRDVRGDRGEVPQRGRLPPGPRGAVDAAPRRRHRGVPHPDRPRDRRRLAICR